MRVRVLGRVEIHNDDDELILVRQRKLRQLVCVLALTGEPVSSEQLQSMLWVSAETQSMLSALTTTVNKLRNLLPEGRIDKDHAGYRLVLHGEDYLDVREFRSRVTEARRVRESDPHWAADLYRRAVDTWVDPHLPDLPDTPAATTRARQLLTERRDAIEALVEVRMALGQHAVVARELPVFLADDPLNDNLWLSLMLAQYRDGRKGDALRTFEEARATYLTKTGAEPSVLLKTMRDQIAHDDLELRWRPGQTASEKQAINAGIDATVASSDPSQLPEIRLDISVPHSARIWNYWLGGKDYFEVDRQAGDEFAATYPEIITKARTCRHFLVRAVRYLAAEAGIRQFLDIGTGLPTMDNTHEVAQQIAPEAKIVYVDHDPLVLVHARALLTNTTEQGVTTYVQADVNDPDQIIAEAAGTLEFGQPIAVMLLGILGHISDYDRACSIVKHLMDAVPSGSHLAQYDGTNTSPAYIEAIRRYAESGAVPYDVRSPEQITRYFDGLELVEPGVVPCPLWRPDGVEIGTMPEVDEYGGVGRKP